jgi:alpha-methylacyl-CoA racemase
MTGWGQDGPLSQSAGHDINYIALAGALEPMGRPDDVPPVPLNLIGDFGGGGTLLAFGVVAALLERERSGAGQVIDAAMVDGVATLMTGVLQLRATGRWTPGRGRNWLQGAAPWYRAYRTSDGAFVTVGPLEAKFYRLLLDRLDLDHAQWPQFDTERWGELGERMQSAFAAKTAEQWSTELEGTDACFAPALSLEDAPHHPHIAARETYVEVDGVVQPAPSPRFSRTPAPALRKPPWPGEHTTEVLSDLGLSTSEIAALTGANTGARFSRKAAIASSTSVESDRLV